MEKLKRLAMGFTFMLAIWPDLAMADAGGPILVMLFLNWMVFSLGQGWIILVEFLLLYRFLPGLTKGRVLGWVVVINLLSSMVGMTLSIPGIFGWLSIFEGQREVVDYWFMLWSLGLLLLSYPITVWIEYAMLKRLVRKAGAERPGLLKRVFLFNALSYAGLCALLFIFAYSEMG